MLSLTPHMPYSLTRTNQPSSGMQDEQVPKVPTLLCIPTTDSKRSPSSTTPCEQSINNSDNDVQWLPMRGRVEGMDEYNHYHWSSSDESNRTSCCPSPRSRASSHGPQTPTSFNRSAIRCIHTLSNPILPSTSSKDLSQNFSPAGSPPYNIKSTLLQPYSHVQSQPINNFGHGIPSISPPTPLCKLYQYPSLLMPSKSYSLPKTNQPSQDTRDERIRPPLPDVPMVEDEQLSSTASNNRRKSENLDYLVEVEGINEQVIEEMGVAVEGEEVAEALSSWSHSVQPSSVSVETIGDHMAVPTRALYQSTALHFTSTAPHSPISTLHQHSPPFFCPEQS